MATPTAAAGCFQSHGEDFVHYTDARGNMMCSVDNRGVMYPSDIVLPNGTSLMQFVFSGLPSVIDIGTF